MANSFIFLATGTSLQGLSLCSPSRSLSTLVIISLLFSISNFLGFGLWLFRGIVLDDQRIYLLGLAVFNILKAFSAAASKLETIRQVKFFDAKNHNAPSETKLLIVHKLSHHFSFGIEFEVFKEEIFVENRKQHLIMRFMKTGKYVRIGVDYSTATWLNTTVGFTRQPLQLKLQFLKIVFVQTMRMERSNQFIVQDYIKGHVHFDSSLSKLQVMMEGPRGSLVKEAGSLVNEVKWNIFGSSFSVLDSGLGFEIGDPSQRTLGGKAVKPTQNSISTSRAVNLRKVNRVRIGLQAKVTKLLMR
ncbi:unnamed protein product [Brassica oleracea var. botrytis]